MTLVFLLAFDAACEWAVRRLLSGTCAHGCLQVRRAAMPARRVGRVACSGRSRQVAKEAAHGF
eukprot:365012-Chlamydomonas_euryale.AAC.9